MKKTLSIILTLVLILGSFSFAGATTVEPCEAIGYSVMGFSCNDLYGNNYDSSIVEDYTLTFINYWSTGCGPCVQEMPHIRTMYNHFNETPENDVNVLGALSYAYGCTPSGAKAFCEQNGYNWPTLIPDSVLTSIFNTSGYIPQTLIVDSHGIIRDHIVGSFSSYNELLGYIEMWLDVLENHDGEECTVTYVNEVTGEILREDVVTVGSLIPAAPTAPTIEGYTFSGWVYDDNILETGYPTTYYIAMGDATVTAHYNIKRYLVRFYDSYNNTILSTQQVEHGSAAIPPAEPNHEDVGLYFIGWDTDFSCITQMTYIHSVYRPVGDVNGDLNISVTDAVTLLRAAMGIIEIEDITFGDVNGNGTIDVGDAIAVLRTAMGIS